MSLLAAMLQAREAVERRSWSHPQEPAGEKWWADVLADHRARRRSQLGVHGHDLRTRPVFYKLRDEPCTTILVACSKCDLKAAFDRDELIATHGSNIGLVELLRMLAAPGCSKVDHHWDRCGAYYVNPIDARKGTLCSTARSRTRAWSDDGASCDVCLFSPPLRWPVTCSGLWCG